METAELITEGWVVAERLYDRLGTKSARSLDVDACAVLSECLERLAQISPKGDGDG